MKLESKYEGHPDGSVTVDGRGLNPRYDLRNHSPTGFNWGYGGSGPAQLALALLADFLGDDEAALRGYQGFKFEVVAALPSGKAWTLTGREVAASESVKKFVVDGVMGS